MVNRAGPRASRCCESRRVRLARLCAVRDGTAVAPSRPALPPPPTPQCFTDLDCQDGNACNGAEVCVAGRCVAGTPLLCADGTPALWIGTAANAVGYVNVGMTVCQFGSGIAGNYVCGPGTLS